MTTVAEYRRFAEECLRWAEKAKTAEIIRRLKFWNTAVSPSLPELRTYNCKLCGVTVTEAEEPRERRDR